MQQLDRIEAEQKKISENVAAINVTLAVQAEQLKEHIRRTALLEADIRPIKRHVHIVEWLLKITGATAVLRLLYWWAGGSL